MMTGVDFMEGDDGHVVGVCSKTANTGISGFIDPSGRVMGAPPSVLYTCRCSFSRKFFSEVHL